MKPSFALLLVGWLAISVVFFAVTLAMGGIAQNGKVEGGHFFLGQNGKYREVSRTVYVVSAVGTWLWAFYGFALCAYGAFQPAPEVRVPFPLVLFVFGVIALISYVTFGCIARAMGSV